MPAAVRRPWLVCYDIADPRRLTRVHRFLTRHAMPIQYSVFVATATAAELSSILDHIAGLIDLTEDDIRAYPLVQKAPVHCAGRQLLPEDYGLLDPNLPDSGRHVEG